MKRSRALEETAVTLNEVTDIAKLCSDMTAVDVTSTDGPARFAEIALRKGLKPGFAVNLLAGWDLEDEDHARGRTEW